MVLNSDVCMVLCSLLTLKVKFARHSFSRTRMCRVEVSIPGSKRRGWGDEEMVHILYCVKISCSIGVLAHKVLPMIYNVVRHLDTLFIFLTSFVNNVFTMFGSHFFRNLPN